MEMMTTTQMGDQPHEIMLGRGYYCNGNEMRKWCQLHIGPGGHWQRSWPDGWLWKSYEIFGHHAFQFLREEDAVLFKLTWLQHDQ